MLHQDLVSILIPAYKAEFFETALISALNQDWGNIEIIVCDDSDNDSIRLLCEKYNTHPARPVYYKKNTQRLLETGNVLRCLSLSRGKYIKFLYDDDTLKHHCVSRLVAALKSHPNAIIASSRRTRIDQNGIPLPDITATAFPFTQDALINGDDLIAFLCDYQVNFIGEPSVFLCYREDLMELGDQIFNIKNEEMPYFADVALMIKLFRKGDLAFISESLSCFRISNEQISQMAAHDQEKVKRTYTLMPQFIKELGWYKGNSEENQFVRVSPMVQPERIIKENLAQALVSSKQRSSMLQHSEQLAHWLAKRHLPEYALPLVEAFQTARNLRQSLLIFVLYHGNNTSAYEKTIASIKAYAGLGLQLFTVELDDTAEPALAINQYLSSHSAEWLMVIEAGETLLASGMLMFDLALADASACDAIYGDEFYHVNGQISSTALRPDFNLDMLLSYPSEMSRHWIFRTNTLQALGGFDTHFYEAWQFEYIVRLIEHKGTQFAGHLPEPFVLAHPPVIETRAEEVALLTRHLQRRGYPQGRVETPANGIYALRYQHAEQPLVSIIIPTKDQLALLKTCVTTLLEKTRYQNYEVLIVDNNSETAEARQWLAEISLNYPGRVRVIPYPYPFNYSAINNRAAQKARGDYLLLLNNDTEVISSTWLDNLMNHGQRPEVGITGAKLLYTDGTLQHAGVVMGLRGPASHPYSRGERTAPGYMNRLNMDQNYSVVTAACLLIRKSVYEQVGGMDEENFKVSYNDVDLCLKVREAGYLTVWTPHAVMIHVGNVSQDQEDKTKLEQKIIRVKGEQDVMYRKWLPVITNDPAYNPNLYLDGNGYEFVMDAISTWQPLHWKPLPSILAFTQPTAESTRRISYPLDLMKEEGRVNGEISTCLRNFAEVARYAPTTILFQQQITPLVQEWFSRLKNVFPAFTVLDMEEYLPGLALNTAQRATLPKDILHHLRATLHQVDRVIVPTATMAELCSKYHRDIHVMDTLLSPSRWSGLNSQRGVGEKPRVGWVGNSRDAAELDILHKVVIQLADRVEWIFMGYCPPSLRQYVTEYHAAASLENFPQKLVSLNLDLALVVRTDNTWTRPQGIRPILEFGACGIPVICSDVEGFRHCPNITRIKNRAREWREAIEMHLHDLSATWKMGDALKIEVEQKGMLRGEALDRLTRLWLPE